MKLAQEVRFGNTLWEWDEWKDERVAHLFSKVSGVVSDEFLFTNDFSETEPNEDFGGAHTGESELFDRHFQETARNEANGVTQSSWGTTKNSSWVWDRFGFDVFTVNAPVLEKFAIHKFVWLDKGGFSRLLGNVSSSYGGKHFFDNICKFDLRLQR